MHLLVISIFLYTCTCESWTLTANLEKMMRMFSERSKQPFGNMMNSCPWPRNGNYSVWPHLKVFWLSKDDSGGHNEKKKKKR